MPSTTNRCRSLSVRPRPNERAAAKSCLLHDPVTRTGSGRGARRQLKIARRGCEHVVAWAALRWLAMRDDRVDYGNEHRAKDV